MDETEALMQLIAQIEKLPEAKQDELMAMVQGGASHAQINSFFEANQVD